MAPPPINPNPLGGRGGDEQGREQTVLLRQILSAIREQAAAVKQQQDMQQMGTGGGTGGGRNRGGSGTAAGSPGEGSREGGSEDEPRRSRFRDAAFGAGSTIAGAVTALFQPMLTAREREYKALRAGSTEAAAFGAIKLAEVAGQDTAAQMNAGQAARELVGGAVDAAFHPVIQKTNEMRGGFGDLRRLAQLGYEISDEDLQGRSDMLKRFADRGYAFDERMTDAISQSTTNDFAEARRAAKADVDRFSQDSSQSIVQKQEEGNQLLRGINDGIQALAAGGGGDGYGNRSFRNHKR